MTNPLLAEWSTPFGIPPFDQISTEHFRPAFEAALKEDRADIDAIANDPADPDFENTIIALERSGETLTRVASVFYNLTGVASDDEMQEIERWLAPVFSDHHTETVMNAKLFARIDAIYKARETLDLDAESLRVLELTHRNFIRAGAELRGADRERMTKIMGRLATLGAGFSQNVLNDEKHWVMKLEGEDALKGLPDFVIDAAASAAKERGLEGHVITLSRSLISPFLQFSANRALREEAWRAWISRGEMRQETDNHAIVTETVGLRAERAKLLGFPNFAAFKLDNQMAKTPERVRDLLMAVWEPARAKALEERDALAELAASEGANIEIQPWDWRYYAEKQRKAEHDLDEAELKPYLPLDAMIAAAFDCAGSSLASNSPS